MTHVDARRRTPNAAAARAADVIRRSDKRADAHAAVIIANLAPVGDHLDAGALIVISDTRMRTRRHPLRPPD